MSAASTIKMTVRSEHPMARSQCVTLAPFVNSQATSSGTRVQLTSIGSFQTILPHVAHCFMATKVKGGKGDSLHLHNLLVGCLDAPHNKCSLMSCVNNCSSSETRDTTPVSNARMLGRTGAACHVLACAQVSSCQHCQDLVEWQV